MNGTLLRLLDEVTGAGDDPALLLSAEDAIFRLLPEEADRLRLAYACSVHRGQGSSCRRCDRRAPSRRRLLPAPGDALHGGHAGEARHRDRGGAGVVTRAARTPDTGRRHSRLAKRLSGP